MSSIKTVNSKLLNQWLESNEAILIDVRDPYEFKEQRIAGSKNIPLGELKSEDLTSMALQNKKLVIHCKSGKRSMAACEKIAGFDANVDLWTLDGGITSWSEQGFATIKDSTILPIERQMQIAMGTIIVGGSLLTYFSSMHWIIIPIIIGLGLINAGVTGWCGMAKCIAKMPWNKK